MPQTNMTKTQYYQTVVNTVSCPRCEATVMAKCEGISIAHHERRTAYDKLSLTGARRNRGESREL